MKAFNTLAILILLFFAAAGHTSAQRRLNPMNAVYGEFWLITPDQSYGGIGISYERFFSPRKTVSMQLGAVPNFPSNHAPAPRKSRTERAQASP